MCKYGVLCSAPLLCCKIAAHRVQQISNFLLLLTGYSGGLLLTRLKLGLYFHALHCAFHNAMSECAFINYVCHMKIWLQGLQYIIALCKTPKYNFLSLGVQSAVSCFVFFLFCYFNSMCLQLQMMFDTVGAKYLLQFTLTAILSSCIIGHTRTCNIIVF